MKKIVFLIVLVVGLVGVSLAAVSYYSTHGSLPVSSELTFGNPEGKRLKGWTEDFLEDLRFKDFKKSSTYHLEKTQKARDIPKLIRRVFLVRHEMLDIKSYKIIGLDFDRSGKRARVRAMVYYRILGDQRTRDDKDSSRDLELLFYWFQQDDDSWAMELESSLRGS